MSEGARRRPHRLLVELFLYFLQRRAKSIP
jgi:hypothetical protein